MLSIGQNQPRQPVYDRVKNVCSDVVELIGLVDRIVAIDGYLDLDGTLSGEHGVGTAKAPYISMELGSREIELMKEIKSVFDPNGILNPGKIFPEESG